MPPKSTAQIHAELSKKESTLLEDFMWVYGVFALARPNFNECPSLGAKGLHEWAKEHQDRFYERFISITSKMVDGDVSEQEIERQTDELAGDISQLLDGCLPASPQDSAGEPGVPPADSPTVSGGQAGEGDMLADL